MKMTKTVLYIGLSLVFGAVFGACASLNPNTEGQILSELEAKKGAFKECYKAALERDRETQGDMGLKLTLGKDSGNVNTSEIEESSINDEDMKQCVSQAASDISLPEPPGVPVEGHYDLTFGFE